MTVHIARQSAGILILALMCLHGAVAQAQQEPVRIIVKNAWVGRLVQDIGEVAAVKDRVAVTVEADRLHLDRFVSGKCQVVAWTHCRSDVDPGRWLYGFERDTLEDTRYEIGDAKVAVIVNRVNAVSSLTLAQLRMMLSEEGKDTAWPALGGTMRVKVKCYMEPPVSQSAAIVRQSCMQYGKKVRAGFLQCFAPFRQDIARCEGVEEVVKNVANDPGGIGFIVATRKTLTAAGVKIVPIMLKDGDTPVAPSAVAVQDDYPLSERLVLYVHPDKPAAGMELAKLCLGEAAASVAENHGLVTWFTQRRAEGEARLAQAKKGAGTRLSTIGVDSARSPFQDLATEYVRAKAVAQFSYAAVDADVSAIGAFITGDAGVRELLLLGDKPSGRAMELHGEKWLALGMDEKGQPTGGGPDEHMIAGRAAAIIVNPANKLESLTLGQVQAIFQGDVDDWAIIGGTELTPPAGPGGRPGNLQINLFGLFPRDPASAIFEKEGVPRDKWKRVTLKKDTAEALAAVSMDLQAIAFVDLSAIPASGQSVKVLPIKFGQGEKARNIAPTAENIKNAMYPLSQRYFLYVHPKASDTAKDFAKFIATCGGSEATPYSDTVKAMMETYQKHGLISLADEAITRAAKDAMAEAAARARAEEAAKGKRK